MAERIPEEWQKEIYEVVMKHLLHTFESGTICSEELCCDLEDHKLQEPELLVAALREELPTSITYLVQSRVMKHLESLGV